MTPLMYDQTIIAQCTPKGSGALALLRLSGNDAIEIASSMSKLASGKVLRDLPTHTIHFGYVISPTGDRIDQVLFLLMHGPHTYTGEHTVEITCHNNPFIITGIIDAAIAYGARIAEHGEFTRRAVMHNKIDLIQAEAVCELIHAHTSAALKQSMAQLEGSLSSWIAEIEKLLLSLLALTEASFEFLDEEISFDAQLVEIVRNISTKIEGAVAAFDQQQHLRNGIRVVFIGAVNAGKSSLFNALLGKDRAIVTEIPGTTRDTVEAGLYKNGNYWTLIDTAGIRQTDDIIEQQGIKRSFEEAELADIVLLVEDGSRVMTPAELVFYSGCFKKYRDKVIVVRNKADKKIVGTAHGAYTNESTYAPIDCSCTTRQNIKELENKIEEKIAHIFEAMRAPFLLTERQVQLLKTLHQKVGDIHARLSLPIQYEILSVHIRDALACISDLSGRTITEQGMDLIFKQFCVGK
jgi:tRNA modification GTPase